MICLLMTPFLVTFPEPDAMKAISIYKAADEKLWNLRWVMRLAL